MEVDTQTEGSDAAVWLPASIDTELEWRRAAAKDPSAEAFIFPCLRGTAIQTSNFLYRVLKETGEKAGIRPTWPSSRASRRAEASLAQQRQDDTGALHQVHS